MSLLSALVCLVTMTPVAAPAPQVELLHFESEGCAACRTMAPTVERLSKTGLAIRHIDVSDEPDTKDKYRVRVVPSFVVLVDGEECDRLEGTASFDRINSMVVQARRAATPSEDLSADGEAEGNSTPPKRKKLHTFNAAVPRGEPEPAQYENFVSTEAPSNPSSPAQVRQLALNSTVRIRIEDKPGMIAYGTGTIIDARDGKALVITCGHLFRDSGGKGKLTVDCFVDGQLQTVKGSVLDFDLEYEIGLLVIEPNGNVTASRVADKSGQPAPGQSLFSCGCNGGADPTIMDVQVTAIDRFTGMPNIECTGSPVEGRSGGGLFDEQGRLVAICFGRLDREQRGAYSGLPTVHWLLSKHDLNFVFEAPTSSVADNAQPLASDETESEVVEDRVPLPETKPEVNRPRRSKPKAAGELVASVEDAPSRFENEERAPIARQTPKSSPQTKASPKGKVTGNQSAASKVENPHAQASSAPSRSRLAKVLDQELSKLDPSAEDADLILIMKSKGGPTAKHKVIVLNEPSPELMTRLAQERQAQELISSLPTRKPAPAQLAKTGRGVATIAMRQEEEEKDAH